MTNFDDVAHSLHATSVEKGFYEPLDMQDFVSQAKQLAMIHSEATEVLEALRKSHGSKAVVEELADILIRTFDLWSALYESRVVEHSLDEVFTEKTNVNKSRPKMHGVLG